MNRITSGTPNYQPGTFDKELLAKIPCPNLRTLANEGWLKIDKDGYVDLDHLHNVLGRVGTTGLPQKVLVGGAQKATAEYVAQQLGEMATGKFNIFQLRGSNLDHPGDTRILRENVDPARLDWMLSFANPNQRIGNKEMATIQKIAAKEEPTKLFDRILGVAELGALVAIYGTKDANGYRSISAEGVRSLYEKARFPEEWKAKLVQTTEGPANADKVGLFKLVGALIDIAYRQATTTVGQARMGADLAFGRERRLDDSSAAGLKTSMCPFLGAKPAPKNQTDQIHGG